MVQTTLVAREAHGHYEIATSKTNFDGEYTAASVIVTLAIALALYNSLEMILLVTSTFKKFKGLYFWSLALCNFGVICFALGMMLSYFQLCVLWLAKTILDIGWVLMILFQSLVLYSRLNLIYDTPVILRGVKYMIIFFSLTLLIPVVVLDFGTTYSNDASFSQGYFYIEQIQIVGITVQELFISGLYIFKTIQLLKFIQKEHTRSMIWQLFAINVIIISMDIGIIVLQFLHYQLYQESIKVFVYSVKLKLELNILSKLVDLVHGNSARRSMTLDVIDSNAIQGQAREDVRREMSFADPGGLGNWFGSDEKQQQIDVIDHESGNSNSSNLSPHDHSPYQRRSSGISPKSLSGDTDEISQVVSNQSVPTARTKGRESDMLYADMLRSMR